MEASDIVLVGDVGGTNTRLQLYSIAQNAEFKEGQGAKAPGTIVHEQQYLNGDFSSFDAVVTAFMAASGVESSCGGMLKQLPQALYVMMTLGSQ